MIIIIRSKENSGLMIKETISKEEYDYLGENADPADDTYYDCIKKIIKGALVPLKMVATKST